MKGPKIQSASHGIDSYRAEQWILVLFLLVCGGYIFPRWGDWNQNSRFDLVVALVEDRSVAIDRYVANTGDYAYVGGHYYSDKAPGLAFLGVPVYALFRTVVPPSAIEGAVAAAGANGALAGTLRESDQLDASRVHFFLGLAVTTFATVAVPSALLGLLLFRVARHFHLSARESLATAVLFGLATSAFPYSSAFVGHQTAAFLVFASFALALAIRSGRLRRSWITLLGGLLGYAATTEFPSALLAMVVASYVLVVAGKPIATMARLGLGAAGPLAALVAYDLAAFGTPLPVGYLHSSLWGETHSIGFLSLTYPQIDALWGLTFGVHRGLFFLSPFLLFALLGLHRLWRDRNRRAEFWVILVAPLVMLVFYGSSAMWQGGFAIGPRYLLPALPFLALSAGVGLAEAWQFPWIRPTVCLSVAWSAAAVWAQTLAGQSFPDYSLNPLIEFALPRLVSGDIARNVGMIFRLDDWASLAPLLALMVPTFYVFFVGSRQPRWLRAAPAIVKASRQVPG